MLVSHQSVTPLWCSREATCVVMRQKAAACELHLSQAPCSRFTVQIGGSEVEVEPLVEEVGSHMQAVQQTGAGLSAGLGRTPQVTAMSCSRPCSAMQLGEATSTCLSCSAHTSHAYSA